MCQTGSDGEGDVTDPDYYWMATITLTGVVNDQRNSRRPRTGGLNESTSTEKSSGPFQRVLHNVYFTF